MSRQTNNINSESIKSINEKIKNNPRANNGLLAATLSALLAQDFQSHNPQESPTYDNAPPVGQNGNPDPLPFYKYQPPVGQNVINWTPRNPDKRITINDAPPVEGSRYNPQKSYTYNDAPPVGQTGDYYSNSNYEYAPPVEQSNPDSVRHTWQYSDPRRTADNAPPVGQTKNLNLDANTLTAVLKLLQRQNEF